MSGAFDDVQHIVLSGGHWRMSQQLVIGSAPDAQLLRFLHLLLKHSPPTAAGAREQEVQLSLGFSRRGLESARVPAYVLAAFAAKAPAFSAGAALRAAREMGNCGPNGPAHWDPAFAFTTLDAVLTLQARTHEALDSTVASIKQMAAEAHLRIVDLERAAWPPMAGGHLYIHFGYRENLSHVGIEGSTPPAFLAELKPASIHSAGEFVLGHAQNSKANPWLASGGRQVWPAELRAFFRNGSFGVLTQIEQHVADFEDFLADAARQAAKAGFPQLGVEDIRAKLGGRTREGRPAGRPAGDPLADFDYEDDAKGEQCPFGAHARRMNPRGGELAHTRARPLLRRGMPYGPPGVDGDDGRGLMGLFFCASIEDQVEHLLGQWAERVPLGSDDEGGARDPLIGAHESGDGGFEIPMPGGKRLVLRGLRPFTRTRGTAYLFYPSLTALCRIADNEAFADLSEEEEEK